MVGCPDRQDASWAIECFSRCLAGTGTIRLSTSNRSASPGGGKVWQLLRLTAECRRNQGGMASICTDHSGVFRVADEYRGQTRMILADQLPRSPHSVNWGYPALDVGIHRHSHKGDPAGAEVVEIQGQPSNKCRQSRANGVGSVEHERLKWDDDRVALSPFRSLEPVGRLCCRKRPPGGAGEPRADHCSVPLGLGPWRMAP